MGPLAQLKELSTTGLRRPLKMSLRQLQFLYELLCLTRRSRYRSPMFVHLTDAYADDMFWRRKEGGALYRIKGTSGMQR